MGRVAHARTRLVILAVAFLLASAALLVLHARERPHYRLGAARAIAAAHADRQVHAFLAHDPATSARVIPLDSSLQRVTFFAGSELLLDAAVGPHGEVRAIEEHSAGAPASGASLANTPWLLALLSALFLLATAVVPLRRLRNLDALVLASLTATVLLINDRLAGASVAWASCALAYLLGRCAWIGLASGRDHSFSTPLLAHLLSGWEPHARTRLLRALLLATVLAFLLVTMTSGGYTDVAVASLQGATELLHGTLPYGHITLALHGDTYPLLNYLLYIPGALWAPARSLFSDFSGSLGVAAAASLLAGAAIYTMSTSPLIAGEPGEGPADRRLRATLAWFSFPPLLLAASGGANDLLVAACLAWMLALQQRTRAAIFALSVAAWVKLVPLALLVVWLPGGRRVLRACGPALALCAVMLAVLLALGGPGAILAMLSAIAFQFQRGSFFAPWYTFGVRSLQPFVQAGAIVLALAAALRIIAEPAIRRDPVRLSALSAAVLLALQLAANYWTWSYLPWVLPFLLVALFMRAGAPAASLHSSLTGEPALAHPDIAETVAAAAPAQSTPGPRENGRSPTRRPRPRLRRPARRRSPSGAAGGR